MIGWTRRELKFRAKQEMKTAFWPAFGVCFLGTLLCGGAGGFSVTNLVSKGNGSNTLDWLMKQFATAPGQAAGPPGLRPTALFPGAFYEYRFMEMIAFFIAIALVLIVVAVCYRVFVAGPVRVGMCSYFTRAPYGDRRFVQLFSAFRSGRYLSIAVTQMITSLCRLGWAALYAVPAGILIGMASRVRHVAAYFLIVCLVWIAWGVLVCVKYIDYGMVPYILTEQPRMKAGEVRRCSREMVRGNRMAIFVLHLSFLGWILLFAFCLVAVFTVLGVAFAALGAVLNAGGSIVVLMAGVGLMAIPMYLAALATFNVLNVYVEGTLAQLYLVLRQRFTAEPLNPQAYGGNAAYGAPRYGADPGGAPRYGADSGGAPPYGGDPGGVPPYGADSGGAPPYGADPGGAPRYGADSGGAPRYEADSGGVPPHGGDPGGAPPYGGDPGGVPPYGADPGGGSH